MVEASNEKDLAMMHACKLLTNITNPVTHVTTGIRRVGVVRVFIIRGIVG